MRPDKPIIQHRTDTDFYKFSMGQFIWRYFPRVQATFGFKNRTQRTGLANVIDEGELRENLTETQKLMPTRRELHNLAGTYEYNDRMFCPEYIDFLRTSKLPDFLLERDGNQYRLEFAGDWALSTQWETLALSTISELYSRACLEDKTRLEKDAILAEGRVRLAQKIDIVKHHPHITFSDFGTRRRSSYKNQDYIVDVLTEELFESGQFLGTSNVWLASEYNVPAKGTSAHELTMMAAALADTDEEVRKSQFRVAALWWEMYGEGLSISLPDTFGTQWFLEHAPAELATKWRGSRQDSMNPYQYGELWIQFYQKHNVNPMEKIMISSDGLNVSTIVKISDYFQNKMQTSFGWGTNLSNDFPDCTPLSLIVKPIRTKGRSVVKLSDNIAKATGTPKDIERYKKIFQYNTGYHQECRY